MLRTFALFSPALQLFFASQFHLGETCAITLSCLTFFSLATASAGIAHIQSICTSVHCSITCINSSLYPKNERLGEPLSNLSWTTCSDCGRTTACTRRRQWRTRSSVVLLSLALFSSRIALYLWLLGDSSTLPFRIFRLICPHSYCHFDSLLNSGICGQLSRSLLAKFVVLLTTSAGSKNLNSICRS